MFKYNPLACLPSAEELPDSDDTPVDNELQNLIPNLLDGVLALIWKERNDWFFGVDMGIYYDPDQPPLVPDGFLSLGVERIFDEDLRLSYVLWEENGIIPILMLEVVSKTRNREYSEKKKQYAQLGVLYYVIYAPRRRRKERLEVYRLENGEYVLQHGNPVWLPEIGLGIGRERGTYTARTREWLYWYDNTGKKIPTAEERAERLAAKLRELGLNPDEI